MKRCTNWPPFVVWPEESSDPDFVIGCILAGARLASDSYEVTYWVAYFHEIILALINAKDYNFENIYFRHILFNAIDRKNIDAVMSLLRDPELWHNKPFLPRALVKAAE
jgi:hypothetical protein